MERREKEGSLVCPRGTDREDESVREREIVMDAQQGEGERARGRRKDERRRACRFGSLQERRHEELAMLEDGLSKRRTERCL